MVKKISKKVKKSVQDYVSELKQDIPISGVYVFGSHAKGTATDKSDIDVAIISTFFGKNPHEEGKWLQRKLWGVSNANLDVVGYNPKQFKLGHSPLLAEIRRVGFEVKLS